MRKSGFDQIILEVSLLFYIGFGMQLMGFAAVGLCLFAGLSNGDYSKTELAQLVAGALLFYGGNFLKAKAHSS